jgi:hypothetical protein
MNQEPESIWQSEEMVVEPRKRVLVTALLIVTLGVLSWAAWLGEVVLLKGWQGLNWLRGYPQASFVGVACVVFSVVLAIRSSQATSILRVALFVAVSFPVAWFSFELARLSLYTLHHPLISFAMTMEIPWRFIMITTGGLVGAALLTAAGFTAAVRLLLVPFKWNVIGLFLLAIALVMPMSLLTIHLLPALNGATDYEHAIKMGYPLFWTNVLMGLAAGLGARSCPAQVA